MVTHPSTNLAAHGRESNLQLVTHMCDALTTTSLRSHLLRVTLNQTNGLYRMPNPLLTLVLVH